MLMAEVQGGLLTCREAATLLRVGPWRLRQLVREGRLPARRLPGSRSRLLFSHTDLAALLRPAQKESAP